ncbi:carbohydrate binding protein with CBM6 domain [Anseongella ginsenosidimutans]|uniref:Carbohydrate binding protein with CBM6 domain n=1 Tax=Anseongella ginsenosidimutans TaxID=496056 RepID=A0A4R3KQX1_9SPHI|nr:DUF1553 domain-containing protein [Anseongella ginsenosidimutans]QEC52933.1 DUF1553 domain-containing protein [Anseongella ginsenosidimutans]TCS87328.1 carbohydrate binding protein with CBM6 domain [Anseongella ginsenosidimutans]
MRHSLKNKLLAGGTLAILLIILAIVFRPEEQVDFSTQVKPILNKHCISCHGGVKQNGGFSVLFREQAMDTTESGKPAIIPGDAKHSEFIRRLTAEDPEERMPYKNPPLSKEEIDILTRWIDQGAKWGKHWAYTLPEKVSLPENNSLLASFFSSSTEDNASTPIDRFILKKLEEKDLEPSPEAEKATLLRRLSLDLTGLPPDEDLVEAFLADNSADAYEKIVDTLLASPHFGERWTAWWLDMARYSDTKGYEKDRSREIWRFRDWVIQAFNEDKPFDEFTIEQLAGDLLPTPTREQLVATAFHRNTMNNDEGGTDSEEYRIASVIDRVNTTWEVWQSTTFACVQCHSHTYDPFHFEEYYEFMAFFNNTRDEDTEGDFPKLRFYSEEEQKEVEEIKSWVARYGDKTDQDAVGQFLKVLEPKINAHTCDEFVNGTLADTKWLSIRHQGSCRMPSVDTRGASRFYINYWTGSSGGKMEIRLDSVSGPSIASIDLPATQGRQIISAPVTPVEGRHDLYLVFINPTIDSRQSVCYVEWMAFRDPLPGEGEAGYGEIKESFFQLVNANPSTVPVMVENPPHMSRTTQVFERGNWMVKGEVVQPDVPDELNDFPEGAPRNRLGLAQWLVSPENPLTARTMVNRFWEQLFGRGLVETLEDMGSQGSLPTHPALLDWLALRFVNEMDWSMKKLLKEMVMSATYRQSSKASPELIRKDPDNKWYARGPRFRLSAEQVRDQALAVSGLLSDKMFGPSVMPWQPEGVWQTVYSGEYWKLSEGEDQYRRAVYTFHKRTSPYPSFISFDATSREVCLVQRITTNTPLQALVTLNDPVYQEASRSLALKMEQAGDKDIKAAIREGYQRAMLKPIPEEKLEVLEKLYRQAYQKYKEEPEEARKLLMLPAEADLTGATPQRAALTIVANAIMNLDEFLTKS